MLSLAIKFTAYTPYYGVQDDDQAYVITEACYGGTLEHFLRVSQAAETSDGTCNVSKPVMYIAISGVLGLTVLAPPE